MINQMWRQIRKIVRYNLTVASYEPLEAISIFVLLIYTIGILNPLTDAFSNGHAYDFISAFISENVFGVLLLFLALCSLFAFYSGNLKFRWWCMLLTTVTWTVVFSLLFAANHSLSIGLTLIACVFMSIVPCSRIAQDRRDGRIAPWIGHL